ncbi:MAG TPA: phosphoenolpyruvate synthase regulatory protein, partial [Alphaproteobacteria bacterium]|nr:phosphoenolpyruvate synthase regulatory protein [Alphaproteobacteria bacterium]
MKKEQQTLHLHLVSDATGETTHQLARAALARFSNVRVIEHVWTLVRTEDHLASVHKAIE